MKKVLYHLSKGFYYMSIAFLVFVIISSLLAISKHFLGWDITFITITELEGNVNFNVKIPLTHLFIIFPLNVITIAVMWIGLLYYVIYFKCLNRFFSVFVEDDTFSKSALERLNLFFYINLIPIVYALGLSFLQFIKTDSFKFEEDHGIALFHLFIALVTYLYIDMAKKGNAIKSENDLTI